MAEKTIEILTLLRRTYPFLHFSPELLDRFIEKLTEITLKEQQVVYQVGDEAAQFFIVFRGTITLERLNQNNQYATFAVVEEGEFFGLDAVKPRNNYHVRAVAGKNTKVLSINMVDLLEFQRENADLYRLLATLYNSYQALVEMRLSWKEKEEHVFLSMRKHPVFLWSKLLIPIVIFAITFIIVSITSLTIADEFVTGLIILFVALFITGSAALYIFIDWRDDFYMVTDRKVLSRQRDILLYETKNVIPYSAVQSVAKRVPGFWGALLQFGDVELRTYTGVLSLKGIAHPEIITALIEDIRRRESVIQSKYTREENIQEMRKRLGLEEETPGIVSKKLNDPQSIDIAEDFSFRFVNSLFQSLLQLRVVEGDQITYRKHWLVLLRSSKFLYAAWALLTLYLVYSLVAYAVITLIPTPWVLTLPVLGAWLIILAILAYHFLDWRNDRFVVTNRLIMDLDKKPFGKENRRTAPLERIQAVEYNRQGLVRILFNFGTVFIRVGDQQFTFDEVANPFAVQQEITDRLTQAKERQRQNEIKQERETILDWIEIYHTVAHKEPETKSEQQTEAEDDIIQF